MKVPADRDYTCDNAIIKRDSKSLQTGTTWRSETFKLAAIGTKNARNVESVIFCQQGQHAC